MGRGRPDAAVSCLHERSAALPAGERGRRSVHRFDQHLVGAVLLPFGVRERKGGQHGDGRLISCLSGRGDSFVAGGVAFHPHVSDDHVIGVGADLRFASLAEAAAVSTSKPLISKTAFKVSRIASSSSTSRIRRLIMGAAPGTSRCKVIRLLTDTQAGVYPLIDMDCSAEYHVKELRVSGEPGRWRGDRLWTAPGRACGGEPPGCRNRRRSQHMQRYGGGGPRCARFLRRVRRVTSGARVVFTGCYAQRAPAEVAALDGVDAVDGNSHKSLVVNAALGLDSNQERSSEKLISIDSLLAKTSSALLGARATIWHDPLIGHSEIAALPFAANAHQTRPNLKIQDGCGNRCSASALFP